MFRRKREENVPQNIEEVVREIDKLKEEKDKLKKEVEEIKERENFFLQNIHMIRFNPFNEEGGNQSFVMVLLDKRGDGVVVTSLFTKEGSRVYGKPIKKGKSEFSLSKEEETAIKEVLEKEDKK
jgi:hypothetical protein